MPLRAAQKKASAKKEATARKAASFTLRATTRALNKQSEQMALREWIDQNDPLIDRSNNPVTLSCLFDVKVIHKFFEECDSINGRRQHLYDWSVFRNALEARNVSSPRWFVQLRTEELLAGADGMEGVRVDCFVIAEAQEPTLAPAEYIVKEHWPYSDIEDNAPERILPIAAQNMCWQRLVKDDGSDINAYFLQKKADPTKSFSAATFGFGTAVMAPADTSASPFVSAAVGGGFAFSFGAPSGAPTTAVHPQATAAPDGFAFSFSATPSAALTNDLGNSPPRPHTAAVSVEMFGFGVSPAERAKAAPPCNPTTAPTEPLSFGGNSAFAAPTEKGAVAVQSMQPCDVYFVLWSKARLQKMAKEIKSGSRIVRKDFPLRPPTDYAAHIKLVMENDAKDKIDLTVRRLILTRLFATHDPELVKIEEWINACPVYDQSLVNELQSFRERYTNDVANKSEDFGYLYNTYHAQMEAELKRIVAIRMRAAQAELDTIGAIQQRLKEHKLAEKSAFRLLKYYPKNDVQRFRPFRKISGISEMGEYVDVCEPPAIETINPFTGKPM